MTKKTDPDIKALRGAVRALMGSSSRRMLKANMNYLQDLFVDHPSPSLPPHLQSAQPGVQSDVAVSQQSVVNADDDRSVGSPRG